MYFFFSSRRRHTRFSRDWSSDVCSSDLRGGVWRTYVTEPSTETGRPGHWGMTPSSGGRCASGSSTARFIRPILLPLERLQPPVRSEERSVGKEWRSRGGRYG